MKREKKKHIYIFIKMTRQKDNEEYYTSEILIIKKEINRLLGKINKYFILIERKIAIELNDYYNEFLPQDSYDTKTEEEKIKLANNKILQLRKKLYKYRTKLIYLKI